MTCAGNTKSRDMAIMEEDKSIVQEELDDLEDRNNRNMLKLSRTKWKAVN